MADGATPIVEINGVSKQFELQGERIEALRDAHLSVAKGEFVCLIGASGCGKSTLLRILAGFEPPTRGEALMWGMPIAGPAPARGMVFQDYGETVERFIALVGLQRFAEAFPHQLSGGMKQRVAIARVLANDAELVLMDEPFGALDAMTRERLQDELLEIWRRTGLTVVFVTHSIEEAIFLADRVVVMSPGPGRIDSEMRIELPRPRDVSAPEFNDIRRELGRKLHSNLARKAA